MNNALCSQNSENDTVDNILKKIVIKDNPDVEMIGIDDVAIRKGMNYATAIYDLETHHLIALLEGEKIRLLLKPFILLML